LDQKTLGSGVALLTLWQGSDFEMPKTNTPRVSPPFHSGPLLKIRSASEISLSKMGVQNEYLGTQFDGVTHEKVRGGRWLNITHFKPLWMSFTSVIVLGGTMGSRSKKKSLSLEIQPCPPRRNFKKDDIKW